MPDDLVHELRRATSPPSRRARLTPVPSREGAARRVFDANMIGILHWDASGRITEANDYVLALLRSSREALAAGRLHWVEMTPPEYRVRDLRARDEQLGGSPCTPYEKELLRADGSRVPVVVGSAFLEDGAGSSVGFVLDRSERSRAETERAELEARIRQAEKLESLGVMAGGIAHDFNSLLTSILCNADLALAALPEDAPGRQAVHRIEATARRAAAMTRQMLAFAAQGRSDLQPVDLSRLVEDTLPMVEPLLSPAATVRTRLTHPLPPVEGDPSQLGQVVMNLVSNASDALEGQPGLIEVVTGTEPGVPPVGAGVWLEVSDTGSGMSEQIQARIFEPFFSTKVRGRGLGLAAVQRIVRAHGGTLKVQSDAGFGTRFRVWIPRDRARQGEDA
jgi:two-component system cell cycle sensor histidine kinase/response regulator CckA